MRVAFFVDRYPSVSETFVSDQIDGLLARDCTVDVFCRRPKADAPPSRVAPTRLRVMHYPSSKASMLAAFVRAQGFHPRQTAALLLDLRSAWRNSTPQVRFLDLMGRSATLPQPRHYDAIVVHFGPNASGVDILRRVAGLSGPMCVFFHGFDMSLYLRQHGEDVYSSVLNRAERIFAVSERWSRRLVELGAPKERVSVHHMGVACSEIPRRSRLWRPGEPLRLLSVARLVEKKGLEVAMPAVASAARRVGGLEWDLVGDGPLRPRLESLARLHRVPVTFHGAQDHSRVRDLLERSHVLLAPSVTAANGDEEGIPVVIMEAMAYGLLVVSTRHSGIPELVSHRETGLLVAERDSEELGDCLVTLHERPDMWVGMIEKARQRVEEAFDSHKLNDELHDKLTRLALEMR